MRRPRVAASTAGIVLIAVAALLGCGPSAATTTNTSPPRDAAPASGYAVVASYPHDPGCFSQGLQWSGSGFVESCGLYGVSNIRQTTLAGKVLRRVALPATVFAEGLVRFGTKVYVLTWKERVVYVRNATTLKAEGTRPMPRELKEGWGFTTDGRSLIASDGTATVRWIDPKTFAVTGSIVVREGGEEVPMLNELEMIDGELWANEWMTDRLLRIDPATGEVRSVVDLTGLRPASARTSPDAVLNGIAYDATKQRIFVTGKHWDRLFHIRVT